jgi:hypothetical protein
VNIKEQKRIYLQFYEFLNYRFQYSINTRDTDNTVNKEQGNCMEDILSRVLVTTDGVWTGNWIYWPLTGRNYNCWVPHCNSLPMKSSQSVSTSLYSVTALRNGNSSVMSSTWHFLVTNISSGDPSASVVRWITLHIWTLIIFVVPIVLKISSLHGPYGKHRVRVYSSVA